MSLERSLRALFRPREAFDGWTPGASVVLGVVVVLCALNTASVAYAGDAIAGEVDGSVTVDNPARPPDWICGSENIDATNFGDCNASETVQEPLRPAASDAVTDVTLKAALAPLAWVLLVAALFVVVSGHAGGSDGDAADAFGDGLGVAALAAVPGALRSLVRPVAVERALAGWTHPASLDGVRTAAVSALFPDGLLWVSVVAVSGLWTAAIAYGGTRAAFETETASAGLVAVVAFATASASAVLPDGGWIGTLGGIGFVLVAVGVVDLLGAHTFISISKEFELIGFGGSEQVTPKPWYVGLHRAAALCAVAVGFVLLGGLALV